MGVDAADGFAHAMRGGVGEQGEHRLLVGDDVVIGTSGSTHAVHLNQPRRKAPSGN